MRLIAALSFPLSGLILSLPLATVSLGSFLGTNVRIWEVLLITCILVSLAYKHSSNLARGGLKSAAYLLAAFYIAIILSAGNTIGNLNIFTKQVALMAFMASLYIFISLVNLAAYASRISFLVAYSGVLYSIIAIYDLFNNPLDLQTYYFSTYILPRARGYFAEANEFSQYLGIPFSFILAILLINNRLRGNQLLILRAGLLIILLAQLLTFSRGGLVAFAASILAIPIFARIPRSLIHSWARKSILLLFIVLAAIGLTSMTLFDFDLLNLLHGRFASLLSGEDDTALIRLEAQLATISYLSGSILQTAFGIGFGNLPLILDYNAATTANIFIDIFAEIGLFGLTTFCLFLAFLLYGRRRALDELRCLGPQGIIYLGSRIALFGLLIGGLTYSTYMLNIFWLCAGLVSASSLNRQCRARSQ